MSVNEFYAKLLTSLGLIVEDNGVVSKDFCGKKSPYKIPYDNKELTLTLPTKQFLDNPDWNSFIPFHPLSENVVKGESLVIKELKKIMEHRVMDCITTLLMELSIIAADKAGHKKLSVSQKKFLSLMPEANDKTVTVLGKILCNLSNKGERKICSFYIKRGGSVDGKAHKRVAVVSFPIIEELNKDEKVIFDVKVSAAEKEAIKNLFGWIINGVYNAGSYNFGSDDDVAPNFHSLCGAYIKIMNELNAKIELFDKHEEIYSLYRYIDWEVEFNELSKLFGEIPVLPHNDGDPAKIGDQQMVMMNSPIVPTVAVPFATAPVIQFGQAMQTPTPVMQEVTEEGKISWNTLVSQNPALASQTFNPMMPFQQPTPSGGYVGYDRGAPAYNNNMMMMNNFGGRV